MIDFMTNLKIIQRIKNALNSKDIFHHRVCSQDVSFGGCSSFRSVGPHLYLDATS